MKKKIIFIILLLGLIVACDVVLMSWNSEVEALSKYGSRGSEVRTIQEKLKRWGYYSGSVDGIYGSQTVSAVKKFQKKNELFEGQAGVMPRRTRMRQPKAHFGAGIFRMSGNQRPTYEHQSHGQQQHPGHAL